MAESNIRVEPIKVKQFSVWAAENIQQIMGASGWRYILTAARTLVQKVQNVLENLVEALCRNF